MSRIQFFFFGSPRIEREGNVVEVSLRKALALLVYLAITQLPQRRDALAALFWPDNDQTTARANLRRVLHRLRKLLGEDALELGPESVSINRSADMWIDIEQYWQHVKPCLPSEATGEMPSPECLAHLNQASVLYVDDFLAGFNLPDCPGFDEWQFFERETLRRSLADVLVQLIQVYRAQSRLDQAIDFARRWLTLDTMHEPAHYQLMQLYAQAGQRAAALRQFQECSRILHEELGVQPQPSTLDLYETIKATHNFTVSSEPPTIPQVRYVRSGDVHIAYQVLGNGPTDVVLVSGFVSHLEQIWEEPGSARFLRRLASFSRLILFDKRGVGLSDRIGYAPTLEHTMDDMLAVMDVVGVQRATLVGVSEGGPNCILFAATFPERVASLILYGTMAKFTRDVDYPWALTREQWDKWLNLLVADWGTPVGVEGFAPSRADEAQFTLWWARLLRSASSPGGVRAVLEIAAEIDVRDVLPTIQVPTLILHRTGDETVHVEGARYMAQHIPLVKYVELPGSDHWWWVGDSDLLLAEIEAFLHTFPQPPLPDRILVTLMEIEFSGAGEGLSAQWSNTLTNYLGLVRGEIAHFRGRLVRQESDRILALFDGPSRSLQCAQGLQEAARRLGIVLRVGLHTGECDLTTREPEGPAVNIVREVMTRATPGSVLLSKTVKDLVVGSGFQFKPHAGTIRTGLGDWNLYELSSP